MSIGRTSLRLAAISIRHTSSTISVPSQALRPLSTSRSKARTSITYRCPARVRFLQSPLDWKWFHGPELRPLRGDDVHIPPGFTTVFPYIFATDARTYLTFLVQGLGGAVLDVLASPDGTVRNAHVRFGDTTIMVSEARGSFQPSRGTCYLYVEDADAAMARAVAVGRGQY